MAVASTDHNDVKSDFSNWGTTIDVAAPGGDSEDPSDWQLTYINILSLYAGQYGLLRGTSMASPHAAGVAALVLSRLPAASNVLVRELLEGTTDDIGSPGDDIYSGHGRVNAERAVQAAGLALNHSELRVSVTPLKPIAAVDGPAPVDVTVENVGLLQCPGFLMELFDGDPAEGGVRLRWWTIPWLEAGQSVTAHAYLTFPTLGVRTLVGFVDRANTIVEPIKANNRHVATVGVTTRTSFSESAALPAPGVPQFPSISGDVVVWEDNRNASAASLIDIYAYDFSTGQETAIAFDTTVSHHRRYPTISGTRIVWQDTRDGRREIYLHDMATMAAGEEELLTPWPSLAFHNLSPIVSGHRVLYKGTNSWMDLDDPSVVGTLTLLDLTSRQETAIIGARHYDIDGDRFLRDGVHALDLTTGQETFIGVGEQPALSGPLAAFGIAAPQYGNTDVGNVHVRDLVTMQETVIPAAPNERRRNLDIGGDLIVWSQAIYDIGTNQFSTFQIYAHDLTGGLTHQVSESDLGAHQPAVSGDRIIWLDGDDLDLHAATKVPFPTAVANLTGTRVTNKKARLDWSANPEPDVVAYVIYDSFSPGGPYHRVAEVTGLTYLHENLHPNGTYYYRVAARNQAGWEGTFSTEVRVDL